MFEKIFNVTTQILFIIYIIVALVLKIFTSYNLFFKGWYLLIILIPSISALLFHKNRLNSLLIIGIIITVYLTISKVLGINKCFIILACLGIIYLGLNIIISNLFIPKIYTFNKNNRFYWSLFSETRDVVSNTTFNGGTIWSIFGSTTLDLSQSRIEDYSVIKVISIFGSSNVVIPSSVNVLLNSINILGDSKNMITSEKNKKNNDVYIKSITILGSLKLR